MLLEDGRSVAAFFELTPLGTEGREAAWLAQARDSLENALQDSFDELDENPWVIQLYAQDEPSFDEYMQTLGDYVQTPYPGRTTFTDLYLRFFSPSACRGQTWRLVRGHGGHPPALAWPDAGGYGWSSTAARKPALHAAARPRNRP